MSTGAVTAATVTTMMVPIGVTAVNARITLMRVPGVLQVLRITGKLPVSTERTRLRKNKGRLPMADFYEDARGIIHDIITGPIDCVTEIFTKAGAVRGNHVHKETMQWTYVVSGRMVFGTRRSALLIGKGQIEFPHYVTAGPGALIKEHPGMPHAWKALEDTLVLVFTQGPRSGENYESDTERLEDEELIFRG